MSCRERPPDHYSILGVPRFCADAQQIEEAAHEQLEKLDHYALSPDPAKRDACQRLMNEVAKARTILLSTSQRVQYDRDLAQSLGLRVADEGSQNEYQAEPAQQGTEYEPEPSWAGAPPSPVDLDQLAAAARSGRRAVRRNSGARILRWIINAALASAVIAFPLYVLSGVLRRNAATLAIPVADRPAAPPATKSILPDPTPLSRPPSPPTVPQSAPSAPARPAETRAPVPAASAAHSKVFDGLDVPNSDGAPTAPPIPTASSGARRPAVAAEPNPNAAPAVPQKPGKSIVLVFDCSGYMLDKWPSARRDLGKVLDALGPVQQFDIIGASGGQVHFLYPQLVQATPERKRAAATWLDGVTTTERSDSLPGIEAAIGLHPALICLFSSGRFPDNRGLLARVRELNHDQNTKINTVIFFTPGERNEEYVDVMKQISIENGGVFRWVDTSD